MDRLIRSAAAAGLLPGAAVPVEAPTARPAGHVSSGSLGGRSIPSWGLEPRMASRPVRYDLIERQNVDVVRTVPLATPMIERVR